MDERVTLRLPADDLRSLDVFVEIGEFSNRSDAMRRAIKDFIRNRASDLRETLEARKQLQNAREEIEQLRALREELDSKMETINKLLRK